MADKWYADAYLVDGLQEALTNAEVFTEAVEIIKFRKSPQKYNDYYEAWETANFPTSEDDDGWDEFVEAVGSDESDDAE